MLLVEHLTDSGISRRDWRKCHAFTCSVHLRLSTHSVLVRVRIEVRVILRVLVATLRHDNSTVIHLVLSA